jgi:hypothetical protein
MVSQREKMNKIETNKSIPGTVKSLVINSISARGSGTTNYVGTVRLETDTEIILISWNKQGKPHLSVYIKGETDDMIGFTATDYLTLIDSTGKIYTKWNQEEIESVKPSIEIVVKNTTRKKTTSATKSTRSKRATK